MLFTLMIFTELQNMCMCILHAEHVDDVLLHTHIPTQVWLFSHMSDQCGACFSSPEL